MGAFGKLREKLFGERNDDFLDESPEDYVEINTPESSSRSKIIIKPFVMHDFQDIKHPIDALRDGYTIALVNIRPLKDKDIVELKRAINKLKKTCDAVEGDIAGFGEDWIVVAPKFAEVHRQPSAPRLPSRQGFGSTSLSDI
ncbi:cell division protein SepF [Candidatus Woesearchaeota archaeon]|nr:cell division protein SepF [Candidatus Woesearchaeota archaeon]